MLELHGRFYDTIGEKQKAREFYNKALSANPDPRFCSAHYQLAMLLENEFLNIEDFIDMRKKILYHYARAASSREMISRQAVLKWRKLFEIKTVEDFKTKVTRCHELKELKKMIEPKAKNSKLLKDDLVFRRFLLLGGSVEKVCFRKFPIHIPY